MWRLAQATGTPGVSPRLHAQQAGSRSCLRLGLLALEGGPKGMALPETKTPPRSALPEAGTTDQGGKDCLYTLAPSQGISSHPWSYKREGSNMPPERHYIRVADGFHSGLESCVEVLT